MINRAYAEVVAVYSQSHILKYKCRVMGKYRFLKMGALDFLFFVAAILIVLWLLGLVFFNLGTFIWVLLVIAVIIVLVRLLSGRRV